MITIVPVLLVKNEEVWIGRVLAALVSVFPNIIVSDTGSTDSTVDEILKVPNITLLKFPTLSPKELSECRQLMQDEAKRLFNATHIFLVDGDELYTKKYLRFIDENMMAENSLSGFTSGIEVGELDNGELWFYNAGLNRQSIIPVNSKWRGEYPFESPDCYEPGSPLNHYFPIPAYCHGFYHLHHTRRSRKDADVYLRVAKRDQFSMRDAPEIKPEKIWLRSEKEFINE